MIQLIGVVVTVGLADCLNPSTIGPALYLAATEHGLRQVLQFTLGVFAVSLLGGALLVFGPGHAVLSLIPKPDATVRYWLELVAGALLIIGAVVTRARRDSLARRPLPAPKKGGRSGLVLGASIMAVELPTAFPYIGVVAAVVGGRLNDVQQALLLVIYNVVFVLPLLAIALVLVRGGPRATQIVERARSAMERYWPVALTWVLGVLGAVVILLGITGLISQGSGSVSHTVRHVRGFVTHP
jgi:cytochrome c biogenesis protein CcdA